MKVPYLWCDSHTSFSVKRSKVKVTRPINADTHRAPHLPNGNKLRPTNFKLRIRMEDDDPHASATGAMTSRVKVQGHTRPINADTHPVASYECELNAGCCFAYFSAISVSICTKLARSILVRDRIAHQFQGQRSRSQAHIVHTSHLCLFLIPETKCCIPVSLQVGAYRVGRTRRPHFLVICA